MALPMRLLLLVVATWCVSHVAVSADQTPASQSQQAPADPNPQTIQEVGGRLVTSGETVVVEGSLDAPPRTSSIATKIDTPLVETPRSVTIVDRQTLDDLAVIN